ncbi:MAG: MotA/TolQ/ExbB proton channel family protein [Fibrobacterales bacterium]
MDLGTIGGMISGLLLIIVLGIGPARIGMFIDIPSFAIVIGGAFSAMFISYPPSQIVAMISVIKNAIIIQPIEFITTIKTLVSFAEQARKEGLLALESRTDEIEDEFLKKGIQLAVDGTDAELLRSILVTELNFIEERHKKNADKVATVADLAPAFGMVGTLIGLVLMLANMSDVTAIGPAMAVALLTTLYGSIVANLFFTPLSTKLKFYSANEMLLKSLMLEGIMSIQSGDNPRTVEMKLGSFLDPITRMELTKEE